MITFRQRLKPFGRWLRAWVLFPAIVLVFLGMLMQTVMRWQTLHGTPALAVVKQKNGPVGSGRSGLFDVHARFVEPQQGIEVTTLRLGKTAYQQLILGTTIPIRYQPGRPNWALPDSETTIDSIHGLYLAVGLMIICAGYNWWKTWRQRRPDGYLPN